MVNKKISADDYYFDNCPICRAMKEAKDKGKGLDVSELKDAFKQAEEQGGVVGGEFFK